MSTEVRLKEGWGYGDYNIYYNPENCGLRILDSWDFGENYEFDIEVIWEESATGDLYFGKDSGCSCPVPFEDFHSLYDLDKLTKTEVTQIKRRNNLKERK